MKGKESHCKCCSERLRARESCDNTLLVCANPRCTNYWINRGSEIIMVLK
ncbi:MAG TPA: hypothetical protein VI564_00735 [Candidatus Nanoarchaeia archaeon]|nr:hypothetical protein [Candidatus Nanoarchaeia archaeon]